MTSKTKPAMSFNLALIKSKWKEKDFEELKNYLEGHGQSGYLSEHIWELLREVFLSNPYQVSFILANIRNRAQKYTDEVIPCDNSTLSAELNDAKTEEKIDAIFCDCIDVCFHRVMNLSETQKHLMTELLDMTQSGVANKQGADILSLKDRLDSNKKELLRNEQLFLQIFSLSSSVKIEMLQKFYDNLSSYSEGKSPFVRLQVYFSILSSSTNLFKGFCDAEVQREAEQQNEIKELLLNGNTHSLLLQLILKEKHVVMEVFEQLLKESPMNDDWCNWMTPVWPMLMLQIWSNACDKVQCLPTVMSMWENRPLPTETDVQLMDACLDLKHDLDMMQWCLQRCNSVRVPHLVQLMRRHSPLYTLYKSMPMYALWPQEVEIMLEEQGCVQDASGGLATSCVRTYQAYCILCNIVQVIGSGMHLENMATGRQERCKYVGCNIKPNKLSAPWGVPVSAFYEKEIVDKLKAVHKNLEILEPLEYRLEMLENIFSLLFLRHDDLCDNACIGSGEEDKEGDKSGISHVDECLKSIPSSPVSTQCLEKEDSGTADKGFKKVLTSGNRALFEKSFSDTVELTVRNNEPSHMSGLSNHSLSEGNESVSLTPKKDQQPSSSGPAAQRASSCTMSGWSTASSIGEFPHIGFIVNPLVAWDILLLLKDVLLSTSMASSVQDKDGRITNDGSLCNSLRCSMMWKEFKNRQSLLSKHVSDALWRLQVVNPRKRTFGSTVELTDYVNGTLFSRDQLNFQFDLDSKEESPAVTESESSVLQRSRNKVVKDSKISGGSAVVLEKSGLINCLLASPCDLMKLALMSCNWEQAEQVGCMFPETVIEELKEMKLVKSLAKLRPKLTSCSVQKPKLNKKGRFSLDPLLHIGIAAQEGSYQVNSINLIHDIISDLSLPLPEGISVLMSKETSIVDCFSSPEILVLADIALTTELTDAVATELIKQTLQRAASVSECSIDSTLFGSVIGFVPLLQQVVRLCGLVSNCGGNQMRGNVLPLYIGLPRCAIPSSLLLSSFPLNEKVASDFCQAWKVLLSYLSPNCAGGMKDDGDDMHARFKQVFKHIASEDLNLSLQFGKDVPSKRGAFMQTFYQYVQLMFSMATNFSASRKYAAYFSVLEVRPLEILGLLIFNDGVDPAMLEPVALKARINLTSMIVQYCCPPIATGMCSDVSSSKPNCNIELLRHLGCCVSKDRVVLNSSTGAENVVLPCEVLVRDILSGLLSRLREIIPVTCMSSIINLNGVIVDDYSATFALSCVDVCSILQETVGLSTIDLTRLPEGKEKLVFYMNLANLMFLHSALLNHLLYPSKTEYNMLSGCQGILSHLDIERTMVMKRIGYMVGHLGFVSLYDVTCYILQQPTPLCRIQHIFGNSEGNICSQLIAAPNHFLVISNSLQRPTDLSQLVVSVPQLVRFCITECSPFSGKFEVYYSDRLEEQMEAAFNEHLNLLLSNVNVENQDLLVVSSALLTYLSLFENEKTFLLNVCPKMQENARSLLEKFVQVKESDRKLYVINKMEPRGICITYRDSFEASNFLNNKSEISNVMNHDWTLVGMPSRVISYLEKKSPILAYTVQSLHKQNTQLLGSIIDENNFSSFQRFLTLPLHNTLAQLQCGNEVHVALTSLTSDPNKCWKYVEELVTGVTSADILQIHRLIRFLRCLTRNFLVSYPEFCRLLDEALVFMSFTLPDSDEPWLYARQITDGLLRYSTVLQAHSKWPVSCGVSVFTLLSNDTTLAVPLRKKSRQRVTQLSLYGKIMSVCQSKTTQQWQEVERISDEMPADLLQMLLTRKQFLLGVEWAKYHSVSVDLKRLVDQNYLMAVLDVATPDWLVARTVLEGIEFRELGESMHLLLQKLSCGNVRRFLIEYLFRRMNECEQIIFDLTTSQVSLDMNSLQQELMGLILIEEVAPQSADKFQLSHLATTPHLIIEQWLMNIKLEAVEKGIAKITSILNLIVEDHETQQGLVDETSTNSSESERIEENLTWISFNQMVERYAVKALDTTGVQVTVCSTRPPELPSCDFVMPLQPPERHEWVTDDTVVVCPVCNVAVFSLFCRRHHCRQCGRVVCWACSKARLIVPGYGEVPVRVCADCVGQRRHFFLPDAQTDNGTPDAESESSGSLRGMASWASDADGSWYLTTDRKHNATVRHEFGYDYAPSLSLCLALLALHQSPTQAGVCITKLCHRLFTLVVSSIRFQTQEVDHIFVLSMIQTLLSAAKVRFESQEGDMRAVSLCEYYTQWMDILRMLVRNNCVHVVSLVTLENMLMLGNLQHKCLEGEEGLQEKITSCFQLERSQVRHLRDSLVKKQMWEVSLNISTKANLDTVGVWGAWAMACLKGGDLPNARDRFSRVLERPADRSKPCRSSLLPEIMQYLESRPFRVSQTVMDQAELVRASLSQAEQVRCNPPQALVVLHALQNLQHIAEGHLGESMVKSGSRVRRKTMPRLEPLFMNECKYYLALYGNHCMTVQFYMRHQLLQECMEFLLQEDVDAFIVIHEVFVPMMRRGQLDALLRMLRIVDPLQKSYARFVLAICRWLERNGWLHCLLAMQEALQDRLRAAMTLLKMYYQSVTSYSDLVSRANLLASSKAHMQDHLDGLALQSSPVRKDPLLLEMSSWQVNQNINLVSLQSEVAKFLSCYEIKGNLVAMNLTCARDLELISTECVLPSLLGSDGERLAVAAMVVCSCSCVGEGMSLAYRVVDGCSLPIERFLSAACQLLVVSNRLDSVVPMVKGVQEWGLLTVEAVDRALQPPIMTAAKLPSSAQLDLVVKLLSNDTSQINAYMACGRLKSAYLVAVHRGRHEHVSRVRDAAEAAGQSHVATMCSKWLASFHMRKISH